MNPHPVITVALLAALLGAPSPTGAGSRTVELSLGTAANLESALTIRQDGEPTIEHGARYDTRPLTSPFYYAVRFGLHDQGGAWELQLVHHKLHLSNAPEEIQHFEITHGFNVLTLNRAHVVGGVLLRIGAGAVLAHPESTVRGRRSDVGGVVGSGYILTGPAALLGAGKAFELGNGFFVGADIQVIAARARVPIAGGTADAPNVALHVLLGAGHRF